MLLLAFIIGIWVAEKRAKEKGLKPSIISDLVLWVIIGVLFGSRLFYVIMHWSDFKDNLWEIIMVWHGGAVYFGGFVFAFLFGIAYSLIKKLPLVQLFDTIAPSIALGEGIGRIGCFLNGCCFGKPSRFLGVVFRPESPAGYTFQDTPLLPTQLFQSFAGFLIFIFLLYIEKKRDFKKGQIFSLFLILFSGFRFLINFLRYYEDAFNYYFNQVVAFCFVGLGIFLYIYFGRKVR